MGPRCTSIDTLADPLSPGAAGVCLFIAVELRDHGVHLVPDVSRGSRPASNGLGDVAWPRGSGVDHVPLGRGGTHGAVGPSFLRPRTGADAIHHGQGALSGTGDVRWLLPIWGVVDQR